MKPSLADLAAEKGIPIILTSNERGSRPICIVESVAAHLWELVGRALDSGVARESLILDPGIGFGKSREQNLEILRRLRVLSCIGRPLLVGTSRKSFITSTLDASPESKLMGTAASVAIAIANGADIVRVHDVRLMSIVSRLSDAIVRGDTTS
jgi:dihydropteroate synthase